MAFDYARAAVRSADETQPAASNPLASLFARLRADGGRYLLSVGMTREERDAQPEPTFGGKGHVRWLTDEEYATLCQLSLPDETTVHIPHFRDVAIKQVIANIEAWNDAPGRMCDYDYDLMNDARRELKWILEDHESAQRQLAHVVRPEEPARKLSASEAASFDKAFARSPRRVEPQEHLVKGLASVGSSAAVNPRDTVGGSAEPSGQPAEKASERECSWGCHYAGDQFIRYAACTVHGASQVNASGQQCDDPEHSDFQRNAPWKAFGDF